MRELNLTLIAVSGLVILLSLVSMGVLVFSSDNGEPVVEAPPPVDTSIKVAVLNGCGRSGLASMFSEKLRSEGFDVVNGFGENADSFDFDVSVVIDRRGDAMDKAGTVARVLGIEHVMEQRSDDEYLIEDVAVVLGRDWNTLMQTKGDAAD